MPRHSLSVALPGAAVATAHDGGTGCGCGVGCGATVAACASLVECAE